MTNQFISFLNKEGNEEIKKSYKLHLMEDDSLMERLISDSVGGTAKGAGTSSSAGKEAPRAEIDYDAIYPLVKKHAGTNGIAVKDIIAKAVDAGASLIRDKKDQARIKTQLKSKAGKAHGIFLTKGTSVFTYDSKKDKSKA